MIATKGAINRMRILSSVSMHEKVGGLPALAPSMWVPGGSTVRVNKSSTSKRKFRAPALLSVVHHISETL